MRKWRHLEWTGPPLSPKVWLCRKRERWDSSIRAKRSELSVGTGEEMEISNKNGDSQHNEVMRELVGDERKRPGRDSSVSWWRKEDKEWLGGGRQGESVHQGVHRRLSLLGGLRVRLGMMFWAWGKQRKFTWLPWQVHRDEVEWEGAHAISLFK